MGELWRSCWRTKRRVAALVVSYWLVAACGSSESSSPDSPPGSGGMGPLGGAADGGRAGGKGGAATAGLQSDLGAAGSGASSAAAAGSGASSAAAAGSGASSAAAAGTGGGGSPAAAGANDGGAGHGSAGVAGGSESTGGDAAGGGANNENEGGGGSTGGDGEPPSTCVGLVSSGRSTTCAVRTDNTLWCWGTNTNGELGIGDPNTPPVVRPVNVSALGAHVTQVSVAAGYFVCARTDDGRLWCWGSNSYGQLAHEPISASGDARSPVRVEALGDDVAFVAAGNTSTCALTGDSGAWCWGLGPLGYAQVTATATPGLVSSTAAPFAELGVGAGHACAVDAEGALWCWGTNTRGQLGTGNRNDSTTPVSVSGMSDVVELAVGWTHTCALKSDRSVWCWGSAQYGQLGEGSSGLNVYSAVPRQVTALGNTAVELSTHGSHTCARDADGAVWCWGTNDYGELGDGTTERRTTPVRVASLATKAVRISAGYDHTCAVLSGGSLTCWGYNYAGQLGDGSTTTRLRPVNVALPCP
jgi:alpha-tubulin suppressor-like RCC1 family protein